MGDPLGDFATRFADDWTPTRRGLDLRRTCGGRGGSAILPARCRRGRGRPRGSRSIAGSQLPGAACRRSVSTATSGARFYLAGGGGLTPATGMASAHVGVGTLDREGTNSIDSHRLLSRPNDSGRAAGRRSSQPHTLSYQFRRHFHPYVSELVRQAGRRLATGLQAADTASCSPTSQRSSTRSRYHAVATSLVGKPRPVKELDFGSGRLLRHNWELFFHVPLTSRST